MWCAALPQGSYEWAMVPEFEPRAWEHCQSIVQLPRRQGPWTPIPMEVIKPVRGRETMRATVPFWSSSNNVLVLRDEAIESLGTVLQEHGELLPLHGVNARLMLFSALLVEDGLVESASDLHQSPGSLFVRLDRGVFRAEAVGGRQAFVVPVGRGFNLLFRQDLKEALEATGDVAGIAVKEIGILRRAASS